MSLFATARANRTAAETQAQAAFKARMADPGVVASAQTSLKAIDTFIAAHYTTAHFAEPGAQQAIALRLGYDPATESAWDPAVAACVAGAINAMGEGSFAETKVYHREALMGDPGEHTTYLVIAESAEAAKGVPEAKREGELSDPWPFRDNRRPW